MPAIEERPAQLIDETEAARILGLQPQTLSNWRCGRRMKLPFVRLGNRAVRYRIEDLEAFIRKNTVGASAK